MALKENKIHATGNRKSNIAIPELNFLGTENLNTGDLENKEIIDTTVAEVKQPPAAPTPAKKESVFEKIDRLDEQQIRDMEKGLTAKEEFYFASQNEDSGILNYEPSYYGTQVMMKKQGHIEVGDYQSEHDHDEYVIIVKAKDTILNIAMQGMGVQSKLMATDKGAIKDPYARQVALGKAQRNAIKLVLKTEIIKEEFALWYEKKFNAKPDFSKIIVAGKYEDIHKK